VSKSWTRFEEVRVVERLAVLADDIEDID